MIEPSIELVLWVPVLRSPEQFMTAVSRLIETDEDMCEHRINQMECQRQYVVHMGV